MFSHGAGGVGVTMTNEARDYGLDRHFSSLSGMYSSCPIFRQLYRPLRVVGIPDHEEYM